MFDLQLASTADTMRHRMQPDACATSWRRKVGRLYCTLHAIARIPALRLQARTISMVNSLVNFPQLPPSVFVFSFPEILK